VVDLLKEKTLNENFKLSFHKNTSVLAQKAVNNLWSEKESENVLLKTFQTFIGEESQKYNLFLLNNY